MMCPVTVTVLHKFFVTIFVDHFEGLPQITNLLPSKHIREIAEKQEWFSV